MSAFTYPAKLSTGSDGRVLVEFVDLPRVVTDGRNLSEAMEEAIDAPTPSPAKRGQRLIPVPWWLAPKLALYLAMRDHGINNCELARRLNVDERVVRRMLDPAHETKAEKMQAALAVLGKRLTMEVEDAA
jgi:antitoxin HicB